MSFENVCRTCLKEIKKEPVQLSQSLYKFLEDDLCFNDVPRSHPQVKLPKNVCFSCYTSLVTLRRFYMQCKDASHYFKQKLEKAIRLENTNNNYNYEKNHDDDDDDEEFTYITIEKANDISAQKESEHAELFEGTNDTDYEENVKEEDQTNHIDVEFASYDEKFLIDGDDCTMDYTTQEENALIQAAFQAENADIESASGPKAMRLFVCKICGKEVNGKVELREHETTHPGLRPFECEVCGIAFKQRSALNTHLALHYGKTIPCPLCDKKFARKSFLTLHLRAHRGEKPFQCQQCGKTFRTGHILAGHEQEHSGELKFGCKFCSKSYYNRRCLIAHINHSHSYHYCNHCDQCFKTRRRLFEHLKKDHNIKQGTEKDYTKKIEKR